MKLLFFDTFRLGALRGDTVIDLSHFVIEIPYTEPQALINKLIESFAKYRDDLQRIIDNSPGVPVN